MKLFATHCRNILWLYRPYLKYGKLFVFLSLLFWLCIVPAAQMVGILLPSTIVNMLQEDRDFSDIILCVIAMQLVLLFQPMYEDAFNLLCKNRMLPYMDARLKKEVYEKALQTDYRYIDDPEYYDNYTWTVMQYAARTQDAQKLVNRMSSSVIIIVSMLAVIALLQPLAVAVTILPHSKLRGIEPVTDSIEWKPTRLTPPEKNARKHHENQHGRENTAAAPPERKDAGGSGTDSGSHLSGHLPLGGRRRLSRRGADSVHC